jgi:hypothetical protein
MVVAVVAAAAAAVFCGVYVCAGEGGVGGGGTGA